MHVIHLIHLFERDCWPMHWILQDNIGRKSHPAHKKIYIIQRRNRMGKKGQERTLQRDHGKLWWRGCLRSSGNFSAEQASGILAEESYGCDRVGFIYPEQYYYCKLSDWFSTIPYSYAIQYLIIIIMITLYDVVGTWSHYIYTWCCVWWWSSSCQKVAVN